MSAHSQLTMETFHHILQTAMNARLNEPLVISWMVMEPKPGEIGYAASIAWPTNASETLRNAVGETAQEASLYLQNQGWHIPDDVKQKPTAQAIEVQEKSAHDFLDAKHTWKTL